MGIIEETLTHYNLKEIDAKIYHKLIQMGGGTVNELQKELNKSRPTIYQSFSRLEEKGLITKRKEKRKAIYRPAEPERLRQLKEEKKQKTEAINSQMESVIKQLQGEFSLAQNKPGVRFFEGKEGFKEALWDTLNTEDEICTIADLEAVNKYVDEINREYVKKRREMDINKRILITNTEKSRKYISEQGEELTDTRLLPKKMKRFKTGIQIYQNKISYFTLREENITATIIEDKDIHAMQKKNFEFLWQLQKGTSVEEEMTAQEKMKQDLEKK